MLLMKAHGYAFHWTINLCKIRSNVHMFTFQNTLSLRARIVYCTGAFRPDFRTRRWDQWLLNTHCWYSAAMPCGRKLYQPHCVIKK